MGPIDSDNRPPFTYAEFGRWYDLYRATALDPALLAASDALDQVLQLQLSDRDQTRLRKVDGRVKSKRRTWRKINHARYLGRLTSVDDIPGVIDDLVGLRVTCVNVRDIDMVRDALGHLPTRRARSGSLWLLRRSEQDYVTSPKDSGYRGWHVNLGLSLKTKTQHVPIICELQVRTLLQDGWGELTHEDTYSKDGGLPPLVEILSRRMADLLATLDDIAEDLRDELDRIDAAAVAETVETSEAPADDVGMAEQAADASDLLLEWFEGAAGPIPLSSLAWKLQREFGAEITDHWFGHRTFKRFVRHALPEAAIRDGELATHSD